MHSLASVDAGTQTDEDIGKSGSHSPEKKAPSSMVKETEHVHDSDDSDNPYDEHEHEHAEIETAVPVVARARVVSVQKPTPPSLPPRNPNRLSSNPESELNDGFDQVSLNGSTGQTSHDAQRDGGAVEHNQEGHASQNGTAHGADDTFHSMPTTPEERRDGIPGSFE